MAHARVAPGNLVPTWRECVDIGGRFRQLASSGKGGWFANWLRRRPGVQTFFVCHTAPCGICDIPQLHLRRDRWWRPHSHLSVASKLLDFSNGHPRFVDQRSQPSSVLDCVAGVKPGLERIFVASRRAGSRGAVHSAAAAAGHRSRLARTSRARPGATLR